MKAAIGAFVLLGWIGFGPPPMKMGLWEVTSTMTTQATGKMAEAMAQGGQPVGRPATTTIKMCITPETWEKSMGGQAATRPGCVKSDLVSTSAKLSFKLSCTFGTNTMVSESATYFDNPGQAHGTAHVTSTGQAGTSSSVGTTSARFLSADCGDVKPLGTIRR